MLSLQFIHAYNLSCSLDVDECSDPSLNRCHSNATCLDNVGSFDCLCDTGFYGNGTTCYGTTYIHSCNN